MTTARDPNLAAAPESAEVSGASPSRPPFPEWRLRSRLRWLNSRPPASIASTSNRTSFASSSATPAGAASRPAAPSAAVFSPSRPGSPTKTAPSDDGQAEIQHPECSGHGLNTDFQSWDPCFIRVLSVAGIRIWRKALTPCPSPSGRGEQRASPRLYVGGRGNRRAQFAADGQGDVLGNHHQPLRERIVQEGGLGPLDGEFKGVGSLCS